MAKQYRIDYKIGNRQAISATRDLVKELEKLDQTARRAATSAQHAASKIGAANRAANARGGMGGGPGGGTARSGGGGRTGGGSIEDRYLLREYMGRVAHQRRMVQDAERTAKQLDGIESQFVAKDYKRRVQAEQKKIQAAEQTAQQLSALEDRYVQREYSARTKLEAKRQKAAEQAAAKAVVDKQKEAESLAALEDRYAEKEYKGRVAWEAKKQQAAKKEAEKRTRDKQKEADELQAIEEHWLHREYKERVAWQKKKEKQAETEAQALERIQQRYLRREYRERVAFQRRKIEQEAAAQARVTGGNEMVVGGIAATAATLGTAIARSLADTIHNITADKRAASSATTDMQKNLRIEAALMGRENDERFLAEALAFRARSGLDEAGASNFVRQFEGSLPVGIEKGNITRGVADDLKLAAAQRARRLGGDEATHGDLAGILGQFTKVNSAQEGLGKLEAIRYGLTKGRGDDTPLTQQFLEAAGTLIREGGPVGTPEELAALIGVTSLKNPKQAATLAVQLNRGVRLGLHRHRKVKGAIDTQGNYLKKLGVVEKDSIETALDKIVPDLKKAEMQGRDLQGYLMEHGWGQEEERDALINAYQNYQPLKLRLAEQRAMGPGLGKQQEEMTARDRGRPQARLDIANQMAAANQAIEGMRHTRYETLLAEAKESPEYKEDQKSVASRWTDWAMGLGAGDFSNPTERGQRERASFYALQRLKARARQAGVSEEELGKADRESSLGSGSDYDKNSDFVNLVEGLIRKHGGTTEANVGPTLDKLNATLERLNNTLNQRNPPQAPPPLPAPPRGGPIRP